MLHQLVLNFHSANCLNDRTEKRESKTCPAGCCCQGLSGWQQSSWTNCVLENTHMHSHPLFTHPPTHYKNVHRITNPIHKTDKLIRVTLTTSGSCGDEYMSKRKKKVSELAAKYINFSHLICSRCEDMPVSSRELFLCFVTLTKAKFSCCDSELAYNYKKNPLWKHSNAPTCSETQQTRHKPRQTGTQTGGKPQNTQTPL